MKMTPDRVEEIYCQRESCENLLKMIKQIVIIVIEPMHRYFSFLHLKAYNQIILKSYFKIQICSKE